MAGALLEIEKMISGIPGLTDIQKKFYLVVMEERYEKVFQLVCRKIMGQRDFEELRKYYDAGDWFNFDIFFEGAEATVKGY